MTDIRPNSFGINGSGEVVISTSLAGETAYAFIWLPDTAYGQECGVRLRLDTIVDPDLTARTVANDISDTGWIVGQLGTIGSGIAHAWKMNSYGTVSHGTLGVLSGGGMSVAYGVNDDASEPTAVGVSETTNNPCSAAFPAPFRIVLPNGSMEELGPAGDHLFSSAFDVNNESTVRSVGRTLLYETSCFVQFDDPCDSLIEPAQWVGASLGTSLSGLTADMQDIVRGVNDAGLSAGLGYNPNNDPPPECMQRALLWQPNGTRIDDLWELLDGFETRAEAISNTVSDRTLVVGNNITTNTAVLWEKVGTGDWAAHDLNDLLECKACTEGWTLREAHDVNDAGWIVGWGTKSGANRGFLLIPVEECPPYTCLGDVDQSGFVDVYDLLEVLGTWGCCSIPEACEADADCSGRVEVGDLNIVIARWGAECSESFSGSGGESGEESGGDEISIAELIVLLLEMGCGDEAAMLQEIAWGE